MTFRRFLVSTGQAVGIYLLVVAGGFALFLALAPLFGYSPYGDRPGPGWYGTFPALSWPQFWRNAWSALTVGAFFAIYLALPALVAFCLVAGFNRLCANALVVRTTGALVTGLITTYMMLGLGWYISLDWPGLIVAVALGIGVGVWYFPMKSPFARVAA